MLQLLNYLWPAGGARIFGVCKAKAMVSLSLALLFAAKLFVVKVPFIFKRAIDAMTFGEGSPALAIRWMLVYGMSRGVYTLLQELRYLTFTPVGQNALRRFMADAFAHVQALDVAWLTQQSTGELSRVFARGVRGMNALLRLMLFNLLPTVLEAALVISILGRRYGRSYFVTAFLTVSCFVVFTLAIVQRRVKLLTGINEADNKIFTKFFNAIINNEAVRSFTNERHEVQQYDRLLARAEQLGGADAPTRLPPLAPPRPPLRPQTAAAERALPLPAPCSHSHDGVRVRLRVHSLCSERRAHRVGAQPGPGAHLLPRSRRHARRLRRPR